MSVKRLPQFPQKPELVVIVPTRGRPENLRRVVEAWAATGAWDVAELLVARDADDPAADGYAAVVRENNLLELVFDAWLPMVPKLNRAAVTAVNAGQWAPYVVGFAGDDHLPRTPGWAGAYLEALRDLGTGIVYGDDLLQRERLPTQWAMTADIVRALGRMVPPPVDHLYCDNAILALGRRAECIRYLPDVVVEHMHPIARKAPADEGYLRVNAPTQYARDQVAYEGWLHAGLETDAAAVRRLRAQPQPTTASRGGGTDAGPG